MGTADSQSFGHKPLNINLVHSFLSLESRENICRFISPLTADFEHCCKQEMCLVLCFLHNIFYAIHMLIILTCCLGHVQNGHQITNIFQMYCETQLTE